MFSWIARGLLLRFLPRRLLPILTAIELYRIVRSLRKESQPVNEPLFEAFLGSLDEVHRREELS